MPKPNQMQPFHWLKTFLRTAWSRTFHLFLKQLLKSWSIAKFNRAPNAALGIGFCRHSNSSQMAMICFVQFMCFLVIFSAILSVILANFIFFLSSLFSCRKKHVFHQILLPCRLIIYNWCYTSNVFYLSVLV